MSEERKKLLVVDDEPEIARAIEIYGTKKGYEVRTASNGLQALEVAAAFKPDAVLLDISMPGLDGRDVLARWRAEGTMRDTVVIFVTARDEQSDRVVGLELGADDYETKPMQLQLLFRKLEHLIQKKQAEVVLT